MPLRPNRSKTLARSAAGMPGPSSSTSSSRAPGPSSGLARTVTVPPGGECLQALSTRLATTWWSRSVSATPVSPAGLTSRASRTSPRRENAPPAVAPSTVTPRSTPSRNSRTSNGRASRSTTPSSILERSSRWVTSRPSRSVCSSAAPRVAGLGWTTPSTTFSSTARSAAIGVRSSCETLATSSRRCRSAASRSDAIWLKVAASSPISSREFTSTRRL